MKAATFLAVALVLGTAACTEREQALYQGKAENGKPAYEGTGVSAFTAPGWTAGDRNSWEQELKARAQRGQNEYPRVN
ncbi:hypothetical protein CDO44_06000 [Pigmentiphaga sp. NML080357]|uniref:hypothetical protein n=1 Tax=Pigmentiphaga sp. NML080357 TaxID=2008675 RepID=UPI000B40967C|nr:hypothetical protein [Pigmentiphaga sp. NML080357]OVZ61195.1 hypothetical protein CDO44_06000 [Pigmentiphaga sp. NML080357]